MINRRIILLIVILAILAMAASAGQVEAASDQIIYAYSRLTATTAEATICQRELTGEGLTGEMFIYPWEKGMPLELHLDFQARNGDCWTFTGTWEPQTGYNPWTYTADSNFKIDGQPFYYDWKSATFSKSIFIPMAFYSGAPESRP